MKTRVLPVFGWLGLCVGCTINLPGSTDLSSSLPAGPGTPVATTPTTVTPVGTVPTSMLIGTWRLKFLSDLPSDYPCRALVLTTGITFNPDGTASWGSVSLGDCSVTWLTGVYQVSGDRLTMVWSLPGSTVSQTWVAEWFINSDGSLFWGTVDHEPNSILVNSVYVKVG